MLTTILLWLITLTLLLISFTPGEWYKLWFFEILGAGYLWFAALTLILLLALFLPRFRPSRRKLMITLAVGLGFYASTIGTWYVPRLRDARTGGVPLTVMTYNVNYQLWETSAVTNLVRANPVDLFGLFASVNVKGHPIRPWFYADKARSLSHLDHLKQALKIPIDHIFVSKNVRVDQVITLPLGVSDHRPVIAKLRVM